MRNDCDLKIARKRREKNSAVDLEALRYSDNMLEEYIEDFNATLGEVYAFAGGSRSAFPCLSFILTAVVSSRIRGWELSSV